MKYLKISSVLALISLVCAVILAGINLLTKDTIEQNEIDKKNDTIQAIYKDYDSDKSQDVTNTVTNSSITKKIIAKDKNGKLLGTLYIVTGKNAYGTITVMVAISENNSVHQVEFLENGQSFASTVNNHVSTKYPSSESTDVHIGFYKQGDSSSKPAILDEAALSSIDVKCGATYGATLVKELVTLALNDAKEAA